MAAKAMKQVKWFEHSGHISEEYQQTGIHFAFVSAPKDGNMMCHPWIKCRDFMPDAARTELTGKSTSIYSFNYAKGTNPPVDLKKMRVLVGREQSNTKAKEKEFTEMMRYALKLLNYYEAFAGVPLSRIYEVNPEGQKRYTKVFMFVGPKMWMLSPFLISMYTFLIRLGAKKLEFKDKGELHKKLEKLQASSTDKDAQYLRSSWDKMEIVLENRAKLFPKKNGYHDIFFKDINISSFHHNTGLVALTRGSSPDQELNKRSKEVMSK